MAGFLFLGTGQVPAALLALTTCAVASLCSLACWAGLGWSVSKECARLQLKPATCRFRKSHGTHMALSPAAFDCHMLLSSWPSAQ